MLNSLCLAEDADTHMEKLRRKHDAIVEKERAAEKEKEERRKARAKDERERRDQAAAERERTGSSSIPSNSNTPAPWPQGMPITGPAGAAAEARREAEKGALLEQAAEHSARLRQQEKVRIQEAMRKLDLLLLAQQIQRGD
jgi:hypothetical protein